MGNERFYEAPAAGAQRSAPAALRNREPIADVLAEWLGTGEHAVYFAERFPMLEWQPSDIHPDALASIAAWCEVADLPSLRPPMTIDAASANWPIDRADAVLSINMVHISPWASALGVLAGADLLLRPGAPLILYGPWLKDDIETEPSNLAFDAELRRRNHGWGLRRVEDFAAAATPRGFALESVRRMPANNLMLLLRKV